MAGAFQGESPANPSQEFAPRSPIAFRSEDPEGFTEMVEEVTPGVRITATAARGFHTTLRAWRLGGSALLSIRMEHGRAVFPPKRAYGGVTVPLYSGFEAGTRGRMAQFAVGAAHVITDEGGGEEIRPRSGAHLLGANIDASLLESQRQAFDGRGGGRPRPLEPMLRTSTPAGHRLLRYLDWTWRELTRPDSSLHLSQVAREVEDALARMLVEACCAGDACAPMAVSHAVARRAEEFLAAHIDRPLSLAELAETVGVSTRSLSRAFHERHGMGPIGFLRRRRLEAARRDLIDAEPGETDVTRVALRYGFAHLGRFAVDYRRMFGESPSETLRR
jgi:AraC-like DNA-binding protein